MKATPRTTELERRTVDERIHAIRGQRVMLDSDLAALYGVSTGVLNQAVDRNRGRFPEDFVFRLSLSEVENLKSQFVISNRGRGGRRVSPRAFTEEGVAMLSSVLRSERAIAMNVLVMRAFVRHRYSLAESIELRRRLEELERELATHGAQIDEILAVLAALAEPPAAESRPIGFRKRG